MDRALILLTPEAVFQNKIGESIRKLQSKGLVLRECKLVCLTAKMTEKLFSGRLKDSHDPSVAMCWEGSDVKGVIKKFAKDIKELGTDLMCLLYWPELVATKLSVLFTEEEMKRWDCPSKIKTIDSENFSIQLPFVEMKIGYNTSNYPIPLGLLKNIIENDFEN